MDGQNRPVSEGLANAFEGADEGLEERSKRPFSAVTSGRKLLLDGDVNSAWARRYRDVIACLTGDLGGREMIGEAKAALIRDCAALEIVLEKMRGRMSAIGFVIQGLFLGAIYQFPSYLSERFPTEVRATGSAFCYHVGVICGGVVPPVISYFAVEQHMGFAMPMLISTMVTATSVVIALLISPETKGRVFVSDLMRH